MPSRSLDAYRAKRNPGSTPEPFGQGEAAPGSVFVVQKHAARRTHYDLRLEHDGTLLSWAVPKGPSLDPDDKRLAVRTEDHPLDYQGFEGVIPEGNYGAGGMIVWDRGTWVALEPMAEGLEKGKLLFELRGYKLRGAWTLFRTARQGKSRAASEEWLLVKKPDGWARRGAEAAPPEESVLSGLTVEELASGAGRATGIEARLAELGAARRPVDPAAQRPMLATHADRAFRDPEWLFELKYDGFRLMAAKEGGRVRLFYRRGADVTHLFPDLARAVAALPYPSFLLDGEVVVLDDQSRPSFQRLQKRTQLVRRLDIQSAAQHLPATYFAFDLLSFGDFDLRSLQLRERKESLRALLPPAGPLRYADHVVERGDDFYGAVEAMGLEGMLAKRSDSVYRPGRSPHWLKIRADRRDDFIIVGMSPPQGLRTGFGALHLGGWRTGDDGKRELAYAGRVGTGFSESLLEDLYRRLLAKRRKDPPFSGPVPSGARFGHARTSTGPDVWVEPELVCEVRYKEWTEEGLLRQPAFLGLRDDKPIDEVVFPGAREPAGESSDPGDPRDTREERIEVAAARDLRLTNLGKVFWPEDGYTKGDLIQYYRSIAGAMLPYLRDRPLVLTRYPDGIVEGKDKTKPFYQKNAPAHAPDWIRTETIWSESSARDIEYFVVQETAALVYMANLAAIVLHVWSSRLATIQHPDWCILDLDPKEAPFRDVVSVARAVHELCEDIGMPAFVKTSGSTGLHVLLPLGRQVTYDQSRLIGELISRVIVREHPEISTVERVIQKRGGKVYLDYMQNGHGQLLVAPFSVRPLPGAPVSTPLHWSEVDSKLRLSDWTIETVPRRLTKQRKDPWQGFLELEPDLPSILAALAARSETGPGGKPRRAR
jgi:bifunctional non-homologous end joining protein LigD